MSEAAVLSPLGAPAISATSALPWQALAAARLLRLAAHFKPGRRIPAGRFFDRLCRADFERLARAERRLSPEVASTEALFLSFGESLSRLSELCSEIVRRGESLLDLATSRERCENAVIATAELLETPLRFIASYPEKAAEASRPTDQAEGLARDILTAEPALTRALEPLVYVRTLFQIESAALPADVQVMFAKLNGEIQALRDRVRDHFRARFEELDRMHRVLADAGGQRRRRIQALVAGGQARREEMERSLQSLHVAVGENSRRHEGLEGVTAALSAGIDQMVVSMQAHDIVTQKLAHVRHGIEVVHAEAARLASGNLEQALQTLPSLAAVATVQAAQTRAAAGQLSAAAVSVVQSVDSVLARIRDLDEDCLMLREYGNVASAATGTIQTLLDGIAETSRMVDEACAGAQASWEPLEPVGLAAAGLTKEIDHAGEDIRRIALNTQLLAVQHGGGTGLEVLAASTATTAGEIAQVCSAAEHKLAEMTAALQESLGAFQEIHAKGKQVRNVLDHEGLEHEGVLHALRDSTFAALREVSESVDVARKAGAEMKIVELDGVCRTLLPEIETVLLAIARRAETLCHALGLAHAVPAQLRELEAQYTMDSERRVHQASIHALDTAESNPNDLPGGIGADLGSNVELF